MYLHKFTRHNESELGYKHGTVSTKHCMWRFSVKSYRINMWHSTLSIESMWHSVLSQYVTFQRSKLQAVVGQIPRVLLQWPTVRSLASPTQLAWIASSRHEARQTVPRNYTSNTLPSISDNASSIARSVYRFTSHFHERWHTLSSSYRLFHHCILFRSQKRSQ